MSHPSVLDTKAPRFLIRVSCFSISLGDMMLMVLHGNDGVHTHNRGSKDILGATTHYTPVMTIKYGTALKSKTDYKLDLMARTDYESKV